MASDPLVLAAEGATCTIVPELGGSLLAWTVEGQSMLRATSASALAAGDPLGFASFPLVPYSNRIGHARFSWAGEDHVLRPNFPPEPHAIHGIGWHRAWHVAEATASSARLTLAHDGGEDWPWPFEAEQHVALAPDALVLTLTARNRHDRPVPLAFGHHPYFDARNATLCFAAERVWLPGADGLPADAVRPEGQFDFTAPGSMVEGRALDHGYAGWSGLARIGWTDRPLGIEIAASPALDAAVVYIPAGGDAFCFEPVPHIINALQLRGHRPAMPVVPAGEAFRAQIALKIVR